MRVQDDGDVAVDAGHVVVRKIPGQLFAEGEKVGKVVREGCVLQTGPACGSFKDLGGFVAAEIGEEPGIRDGG